jgi:hypothetical protein
MRLWWAKDILKQKMAIKEVKIMKALEIPEFGIKGIVM